VNTNFIQIHPTECICPYLESPRLVYTYPTIPGAKRWHARTDRHRENEVLDFD